MRGTEHEIGQWAGHGPDVPKQHRARPPRFGADYLTGLLLTILLAVLAFGMGAAWRDLCRILRDAGVQ